MKCYDCSVTRVIDGDTVDADIDLGFGVRIHRRVRLRGIDCPESRTSDPNEKFYGFLAKQALTDKLAESEFRVKIKCPPRNDKFGRVLGELWQGNEENINQWLVDNFHAVTYPATDLKNKHLHNQNKLKEIIKERENGLWSVQTIDQTLSGI